MHGTLVQPEPGHVHKGSGTLVFLEVYIIVHLLHVSVKHVFTKTIYATIKKHSKMQIITTYKYTANWASFHVLKHIICLRSFSFCAGNHAASSHD